MKKGLVFALLVASLFLSFCSRFSTEGLPDKGIAILAPNANDAVQAGTPYEIQWKVDSSDPEFGDVVAVELSKNGGKSWEEVEVNIPRAGKYLWKVPRIDSTQCKIRVFSQRRSEYRGTSGVFIVK